MTEPSVASFLRRFQLLIAASIFPAAAVELWLVEHFEDRIQLVPFALCTLGFAAVVTVWWAPRRATLRALQVSMLVVAAGSAFGLYEHLEHNVEFELEIRPNAQVGDVLGDAFSGANPLLAPGILGLAAVLALGATYRHPATRPPAPGSVDPVRDAAVDSDR